MTEELSKAEIENLLHEQAVGRIACVDNNTPYLVPISYVYDGVNIYCHTIQGRKTEIMRKNPKVCFEVDSFEKLDNWQSVICWGNYEELTKEEERRAAIEKLAQKNLPVLVSRTAKSFPEFPFYPQDLNELEGIVFKLVIEAKSGRCEKINYHQHVNA